MQPAKYLTTLARLKNGASLSALILATLLLAACGGGGGSSSGGGGTTASNTLATELNSVPNGIILSWDNPADVRNLTITTTSYASATAVIPLDTSVRDTYTSRSGANARYLREGRQTLDVAAIPNKDRYYSFSITRGFDNDVTDTLVSERLYLPPATISDVRLSLSADKESFVIRWTNSANILGITTIRIGYWLHSTPNGPTASVQSFHIPYNETSAIVSSNLTTTPATVDANSRFVRDRYYSVTVTPIYTGGIVGPASRLSNPQYRPPSASTVSTELNADSSEVAVSWAHQDSIPAITSINITSQGYDAATGGNLDGDPVSVIYSESSDTVQRGSRALSIGENGIVAGKHYSFTVTPTYAGDIEGITSVVRSSRVEFLNRAGVRDLQAFQSDTAIRLTWTNPLGVTGINLKQTSGDTTTTLADNSNDANLIRKNSQVVHDVTGLSANTSYTFSVTAIYADSDAMPVNITIRSLAIGSINDDLDAFNDDQDVDDDGNGLIELHNVDDLNMMRADLAGASLAGDRTGCGGVLDSDRNIITTCSGYELMAHVDLNDIDANLSKSNWEPVGGCTIHNAVENCGTTAPAFSGTFDGNNYNISNLRIIITTAPFTPTHNIGFFRVTDASDLRNIVIRNASMSFTNSTAVYENIGLLVGAARATKISHSAIEFTEMDVSRGVDVGGFIGQASNSQIISSSVIGNRLTAANRVGGLVGGSLTGAVSISSSAAIIYNISDSGAAAIAAGLSSGSSTGFGGLYGAGANSKHRFTFSAAITHSIGSDSVRGAGGLASFISEQGLINASYVLSSNINSGGNISGIVAFAEGGGVESSYYNVTNFGSPPTNAEGIALDATGPQPSLQPDSFTSTDAADFTAWDDGWCDTTTGEFSQNPTSALALSNGGANYAWKIGVGQGVGKFPVPACTPFSPDILRTAISKVRNATNPVPIN